MSERIYEKPKLHRLDGRYHSAQSTCGTGSAHNCAAGTGYGSQTTHTCLAGNYASTCSTGSTPGNWEVCTNGPQASKGLCNSGASGNAASKCATGYLVG
ncbi:MAG: hypothetical protein H6Q50_581 [Deltaproteobacteria bacterium]|jgi:hypothetical protein|nr:hypothetical protein [Deltaproteobacteria bacterium]